jgi:hypothetical protein
VHPTSGSLRVFRHFVWLQAGSGKTAFSRPAHLRVTQAVRPARKFLFRFLGKLIFGKVMSRHRSSLSIFARTEMSGRSFFLVSSRSLAVVTCPQKCHNILGDLVRSRCARGFHLAPKVYRRLEVGSVNACGLTRRAADNWESPRFSGIFLASRFFRFQAESSPTSCS